MSIHLLAFDLTHHLSSSLFHYDSTTSRSDILRVRDDLANSIERQRAKLAKLEVQPNAKVDQINEARIVLQDKLTEIDLFHRGLFHISLPKLVVERAAVLRQAAGYCGAMFLGHSAVTFQASSRFFTAMQMGLGETYQDANAVLDKLALPPIEETAPVQGGAGAGGDGMGRPASSLGMPPPPPGSAGEGDVAFLGQHLQDVSLHEAV